MNNVIKTALLSLSLSTAIATGTAQAAPILTLDATTSQLTGALGVKVGTSYYNVEFLDGSCLGLGICNSAFVFDNYFAAMAASQALIDQVFLDGVQGLFDSTPHLTRGCESTEAPCAVITPYSLSGGNYVEIFSAENSTDDPWDNTFTFQIATDDDTIVNSSIVYAKWARAAGVPEPGMLALAGPAIALLLAAQRRRQKQLV